MNTAIHLDRKDIPIQLQRFSGNRFKVEITDSVCLNGTYWSGGSKNTYGLINLSTGQYVPMPGNSAPPEFGGNQEGRRIQISPGYAVTEQSIFSGKHMPVTFYVHPDNATKLLPDQTAATEHQKIVLKYTSRFKNTYGGRTNIRFSEAARDTGITKSQWDTAYAECIGLKYLNAAGAITSAGRNHTG